MGTGPSIREPTRRSFRPATMVVFTGSTPTGCGTGSSATGPFYCPADEMIYLDLGFFRERCARCGAPGDRKSGG